MSPPVPRGLVAIALVGLWAAPGRSQSVAPGAAGTAAAPTLPAASAAMSLPPLPSTSGHRPGAGTAGVPVVARRVRATQSGPQAGGPGRVPTQVPLPPPPSVTPGTETESRQLMTPPPRGRAYDAESSARELQPGVGEFFIPPPPIPPVPPSMRSLQEGDLAAAAREPISLEQLEELACRYNAPLKQARAQVEVAFGTAIQAGLWPNPSLSWTDSSINPTAGGFNGMIVTQTIPTMGKKRLDRARWLEVTKASQWKAMAVEYRVLNDIRRMYFLTLGWQAMAEIQKDLVKNAEDFLVTTREAYNLGLDNVQSMHLNNAALQEQRIKYLRYQNMYRMYWQRLMAIVGVQMPFTHLAGHLEGDTTPIEWDMALQRLFEYSPEVHAAYANLRFEQINLKLQRIMPWPNVQVVGSEGYNFSSAIPQTNVQVHLIGVPVWNWNQGYIREANANVIRQQAEIKRLQQQLQDEMALVYQSYLTAIQQVESYEKVILPELRRNYETALDSYEDDRTDWTRVLSAQRTYYETRQAYATQLMTWRESEVLIVGFLLTGGTAPAPAGTPAGRVLLSAPNPAAASQFVAPGTFLIGP